ncbi:tetratricopeptide repeat protein [Candidatus Bathyarchaeota archaeon]|nr:tetratricopeptide repeat protein [Candidatus Bathyarchaeota archaeon]
MPSPPASTGLVRCLRVWTCGVAMVAGASEHPRMPSPSCSPRGKHEDAERDYTEALEIRRELATKSPGCYRPDVAMVLFNIACLHARQENVDVAIKYLSQAIEIEETLRGEVRDDADFDAIRDNFRFKALIGDSNGNRAGKGDGDGDAGDPGETGA